MEVFIREGIQLWCHLMSRRSSEMLIVIRSSSDIIMIINQCSHIRQCHSFRTAFAVLTSPKFPPFAQRLTTALLFIIKSWILHANQMKTRLLFSKFYFLYSRFSVHWIWFIYLFVFLSFMLFDLLCRKNFFVEKNAFESCWSCRNKCFLFRLGIAFVWWVGCFE